jgi:hypothetical protein
MTVDPGPFTAATATRSRWSSMSWSAWVSVASKATMPPPGASCCINRPRAATSRHASSSDNTPATCAAANSPTECPATTPGTTPSHSTNPANATSNANNPACANTVSPNNPPSPPLSSWITEAKARPPKPPSWRGTPDNRSSNRPHTPPNVSANTGNTPARARPIPGHCAPCPENTNPTPPPAAPTRPTTTRPLASPPARRPRPVRA